MRFEGDLLAHFDAGLALAIRDELEVVGDAGALFLDDPWHCRKPVIELRRDDGVERIELEPVDSYRLEAENLSAAIRGERRAAARPRGRDRPGPDDRGAVPVRRQRPDGHAALRVTESQAPLNAGARFSTNAIVPSRKSFVRPSRC